MDARLQYFNISDKLKLYYELWAPDAPRAMIVFLHGLGDHVGRYSEFVRYFLQRNIGMCLFDQRGHGRSAGRRSHVRSLNDLLKDVSLIIDMVQDGHPNVPLYLAGHSLGGELAVNFAAKYSKGLRGLIVLSPNFEPLIKIPKWKIWAAGQLSKFFPIAKLTADVDPAYFTHEQAIVNDIRKDPLRNWHITARFASEIKENLALIPRLAYQVKIPSLFCHGSDDRITSCEATRKFYHSLLIQNKELKIYPGAYHQLLHETIREKVYSDIYGWMDGQLNSYTRIAGSNGGNNYAHKEAYYHMFDGGGVPMDAG